MTEVCKSSNDDGMAKAVKKTAKKIPKVSKPVAKAKAPKKDVKKLKSLKKPALDAKAKAGKTKPDALSKAGKLTPKAKGEMTPDAKGSAGSGLVKKLLTKMGLKSGEKTKKKSKRDEEELLPEPTDSGEDLPDLNEFEEEEIIVEEDLDDDSDEDLEDVETPSSDDEVILTDAEGRRYCKVKDCDQISTVEGYCRYHYLLLWKRIQVRRKILADGKLERYVEELTARYPDKFLEMIRRDLKTEKDFQAAIAELEIDESNLDGEYEDEAQSFIDEVRGVSETGLSEEEEF